MRGNRENISKLLNIKYPLLQGGMARIATGAFAAHVSNAGALGVIGSGGMRPEKLREEITICKSLTDKPFGVNLMLLNPHCDEMAKILIDEQVPVVTTGAGSPGKYIAAWLDAGIKVLPVVASPALAIRMERLGVHGVIAEGTEAGGHIGELTTMALLPQVCDAVQIPVIAAGGIATGEQLLATFILGASGVQVGTCLLAAAECPIHENYQQAIIKAKGTDTTVLGRISGTPTRVLKNQMVREYLKREREHAEMEELERFTLGALGKAVRDGDIQSGSLMAGQVVGQVNQVLPVAEIIANLFAVAKASLTIWRGDLGDEFSQI